MKKIGLTGGIGTGKSTVGRFLEQSGVSVLDADRVARNILKPGSPTLDALQVAFAPDRIVTSEGRLDRQAMRARICRDPLAKVTLEQITHPAIRDSLAAQLLALEHAGKSHAVVEAALLVETGSYRDYDALIVVTCAPDRQLRRVIERDCVTEESARALINRQLPLAEKEAVADHVIRNDATLDALRMETRAVWATISS